MLGRIYYMFDTGFECRMGQHLKPHCIESSRVLVPAGTSKSMLRRHGIQAVTRVMAYVTNAVTL
jgi:hypothetical protein